MEVFDKIKSLGWEEDVNAVSDEQIVLAEKILDIIFPVSYKNFLKQYIGIRLKGYEPYVFDEREPNNIIKGTFDARKYFDLPKHLIPFLEDNGDYYCFDKSSKKEEFNIRYWSHNGLVNENWENFLDWAEKCWLGEYSNPDKRSTGDLNS